MINKVINIAKKAGNIIMEHYSGKFEYDIKLDSSPVTKADLESNLFIVKELSSLSIFPVITEESPVSYEKRKNWKDFWIVDPLDGTKDFLDKNDEFTVNICLIKNRIPYLGVVYAPALKDYWYAVKGHGAYKNDERIFNRSNRTKLIGSDSRHHSTIETKNFFKRNNIIKILKFGSSLKFCKLAEGEIDIYPRLNGTKEWDTAASDIILEESGCMMLCYEK